MFLDSLVGDADWMAKYAISKEGEAIPWDLVADQIKSTHPYKVFALRGMIAGMCQFTNEKTPNHVSIYK